MKLDFDVDDTPSPARFMPGEDMISRLKITALGIGVFGMFSLGMVQAFSPQARQIRHDLRTAEASQNRNYQLQQQQQRHVNQARQIAEQRYEDGCLLVYITGEDGQAISLWEGMAVVDAATSQPLAPGTIVCDANGATAVLESGGLVGAIAVTPDLALVENLIRDGRVR